MNMKKKRYVAPANDIVALKRVILMAVSGGDRGIPYGGEDIDGSLDPS